MVALAVAVPVAKKFECGKKHQTSLALIADPAPLPAEYDRLRRNTAVESTEREHETL